MTRANPDLTKYGERLLRFVRQIARLKKDGDIDEATGQEWEAQGNDDEVDTLYDLINTARELTKGRYLT